LRIARPSFEHWAKRFSYELDLRTALPNVDGRPPPWGKVVLLREHLETHQVVLWLDADTVVVDDRSDLAATVSRRRPIALTAHRYADQVVPNTGVIALRSGEFVRRLLDQLWSMTQFIDHKWWENAALLHLMGYDVSAEPIRQRGPNPLTRRVNWLSNEWNSITLDPAANPKILHFAGISNEERVASMERAAAELSG
jgi:hypothetical protein